MIPNGYRYTGRGIWLDGFRKNELLNFGKHSQVAPQRLDHHPEAG